jgi:malate synthase
MTRRLDYRNSVLKAYPDVYTPAALEALEVLAPLNRDRRELMARRVARRLTRERRRQRIAFLDPQALIPRTGIRVQDARDGNFEGSEIPADLKRQWIQGTGPVARPRASTESGLRNAAYALLSGADGWMFDGEDALGQVDTMSLDTSATSGSRSPKTHASCASPKESPPR